MGIVKQPARVANPHLKALAVWRAVFAIAGCIVLITAAQAPSQATGAAAAETWIGWSLIGLAVLNAFIASAAKAIVWRLDHDPRLEPQPDDARP